MNYRLKIPLLLLAVLSLAACSKEAVYIDESFSNDSPFKLRVAGDTALACESARRSLLGQGYLIELANSDEVKARKATRGENTFIEMNVVCVPESSGSTIFAAGVLSSYDLKKNSSSASVGLSALGSISLPIGQSVDSLVKVSEETIDDKGFYQRFFAAVDTVLEGMEVRRDPAEVGAEPEVEPEAQPIPPHGPSAIWPELFPEQADPETGPKPLPAQSDFETPTPPVPAQAEPAVTMPEPALEEEPFGIPPMPIPDEEPLGIPAIPDSDEEPVGIPQPGPDEEPLGIPAQSGSQNIPDPTFEDLF